MLYKINKRGELESELDAQHSSCIVFCYRSLTTRCNRWCAAFEYVAGTHTNYNKVRLHCCGRTLDNVQVEK